MIGVYEETKWQFFALFYDYYNIYNIVYDLISMIYKVVSSCHWSTLLMICEL